MKGAPPSAFNPAPTFTFRNPVHLQGSSSPSSGSWPWDGQGTCEMSGDLGSSPGLLGKLLALPGPLSSGAQGRHGWVVFQMCSEQGLGVLGQMLGEFRG